MDFYVYVLISDKDGKRYIGYTRDLKLRLSQHNKGMVRSTKSRRPLNLVYFEEYDSKSEALDREKFSKQEKEENSLIIN